MSIDPLPAQRPPRTVVISVAIHAMSAASGFVYYALSGRYPDSIGLAIGWLIVFVILYAYIRAIYVGYNWVRWLSIVFAAIAPFTLPSQLAKLTGPGEQILYIVQFVYLVTAAILLLLPSSGRWYKDRRAFRQERAARRIAVSQNQPQ